jgi:tetratricopeptide (TPR) repeat protein
MRKFRAVALVLAATVALVSCNTDPNVAKKRYLDIGNKYFDKGNYKAASIMYRRSLEKDKRYGPAYYKLGLTFLKQKNLTAAVNNLRRAVELLPKDQPDRWDALIKWTDIYLAVVHEPQQLAESEQNIKALLAHDPNSFDAHRMSGDLNFVRSLQALQRAGREEGKKLMDAALAEYRTAESLKPGEPGVMMQLARGLELEGDAAGAEQYFKKVIEKDKSEQAAYTELYRMYMHQKGRQEDAEKLLKLAFQNNPKNYSYLTSLAMHYSLVNRRQDMLDVLAQIKSHAKDYPQAYEKVGMFYLRLGDPDSAIREYKEGMTKDPTRKALYQKSEMEVLMRQGKRGEAAEVNQQILKENPNDSDARSLEASFLLDKGDINRALAELQSVVTRSPDNPVARYNLGRAHIAKGEWEQARQAFQKAIELNPSYMLARLALAQLLVTRGDFDAALKSAQEILKLDRQNKSAQLIESAAFLGQKKYAESRSLLNAMLVKNPNSPDVLFQLGVVDLAEGKYKDANDSFKRTYELNPANSRGLMGMVETDMAENKPDNAIKTLEAEAAKAPNRLDVQLALGNTEVRAGRYDLAIGYFQRVLNGLDKTTKARGDIYMRIGETYRRKGDLQDSISALEDARKFLPDNIVILSTLGLVLDSAGKWPEAKQVYSATVKMDPNNAVSLNNLAFLMAEHGDAGDLDTALTMAQRAKQMLPNLPEVSDTLGWIYLKKNLSGDAVDIFKDLVGKVPNSSTYRYHLAKAYAQQGDKVRAQSELLSALKFNPTAYEKTQIEDLLQKVQ